MKELFSKIKPIFNKLKPLTDKIVKLYKKYSDIATPTAVLAIICIVVTLALSSTNLLTKDTIAELQLENEKLAMAKVMEGDYETASFTVDDQVVDYHLVKKDGQLIGYIFKTSAKGYGGEISVMTAINPDASVAAVEILDASGETPGLGQNVTKEYFYSQYNGRPHDIVVVKGGNADKVKNEIDAVTGATISSKAVTKAVNTAIEYATAIIESSDEAAVILEDLLPEGDELK